jgi:hypothetical protein
VAILTLDEAASILDYTSPTEMPPKVSSVLLPAVDDFLKSATGKDWGTVTDTYTAIDPTAKMAAGVLLARWFEDPGMLGKAYDVGVLSLIGQLEAKALQEKQAGE